MEKKSLKERYNLPEEIQVSIHKSKKGFTAILPEYPGCITFAESMSELVENVNDALLTYFEVPQREAKMADFTYAPCPPAVEHKPSLAKKTKEILSEFISVTPRFSYA